MGSVLNPLQTAASSMANELVTSPGYFSHWSHYCLAGGALVALINGIALAVLSIYVAAVICGILAITQLIGLYFLKKFTVLKSQQELTHLLGVKTQELQNTEKGINEVHQKLSSDVIEYQNSLELEKKRSNDLTNKLNAQIELYNKLSSDNIANNEKKQREMTKIIQTFMADNKGLTANIAKMDTASSSLEGELKTSNSLSGQIVIIDGKLIDANRQIIDSELEFEKKLKNLAAILEQVTKEHNLLQEQITNLSNTVKLADVATTKLQATEQSLSQTTARFAAASQQDEELSKKIEAEIAATSSFIAATNSKS